MPGLSTNQTSQGQLATWVGFSRTFLHGARPDPVVVIAALAIVEENIPLVIASPCVLLVAAKRVHEIAVVVLKRALGSANGVVLYVGGIAACGANLVCRARQIPRGRDLCTAFAVPGAARPTFVATQAQLHAQDPLERSQRNRVRSVLGTDGEEDRKQRGGHERDDEWVSHTV